MDRQGGLRHRPWRAVADSNGRFQRAHFGRFPHGLIHWLRGGVRIARGFPAPPDASLANTNQRLALRVEERGRRTPRAAAESYPACTRGSGSRRWDARRRNGSPQASSLRPSQLVEGASGRASCFSARFSPKPRLTELSPGLRESDTPPPGGDATHTGEGSQASNAPGRSAPSKRLAFRPRRRRRNPRVQSPMHKRVQDFVATLRHDGYTSCSCRA